MSIPNTTYFAANLKRFTGFADHYDRFRPAPPEALSRLLSAYAKVDVPALVVDLGSGTGLSTRYWSAHAHKVVGVEPSDEMRATAMAGRLPDNVNYQSGFSHELSLPNESVDIMCCSQALHWMEPLSTFREAARVLRPGGVFAAIDYDWPPTTGFWEVETAYDQCINHIIELEKQLGLLEDLRHWDKAGHLGRMKESGCFRYVHEIVMSHQETGNAERFLGILLSQGSVIRLLGLGRSEAELGIAQVRAVADRVLGDEPNPWHWGARMRIGIV